MDVEKLGMVEKKSLVDAIESTEQMVEKIYRLCGVAHTNIIEWLEADGLLTVSNLKRLHRYAIHNMKKVYIYKDDRGFFHVRSSYFNDNYFCHIHKRQAQYYRSISDGYWELFSSR